MNYFDNSYSEGAFSVSDVTEWESDFVDGLFASDSIIKSYSLVSYLEHSLDRKGDGVNKLEETHLEVPSLILSVIDENAPFITPEFSEEYFFKKCSPVLGNFESLYKELNNFSNLHPDWDGFGGVCPELDLVNFACLCLCDLLSLSIPLPKIMLSGSGSISFYWKNKKKNRYIEIQFDEVDEYSFLICDGENYIGREDLSYRMKKFDDSLLQYIRSFFSKENDSYGLLTSVDTSETVVPLGNDCDSSYSNFSKYIEDMDMVAA
ncbi:hypothetical protein DT73_17185 [Mangrovibacter sp. MFB070]|uniref:hypothetical protein n=1 Tax=Mangrovibacter sp. MFB070 TaxID=1224318 RepID=UPI0004D8F3B5|nr:hypothetical protein [Mangrovibacter sp. MFB070]KEA51448.1 hypothetical protein DT73_17185 [Mangrovibacter sp. MFB070]